MGLIETIWCYKLKMPPLVLRRLYYTLSSADHRSSCYITTPLTAPFLFKGDKEKISFDVAVTFLRNY